MNESESENRSKTIPGGSPVPFSHTVFDFIELFVIALCAVFLVFMGGLRLCRVDGDSMRKTLEDGQMLIVSDVAYTPKAGDIVVFHQTSEEDPRFNEPIVKRVIATGGQYVMINAPAGKVYVSDDETFDESDALDEPYVYLEGGNMRDYYKVSGKVIAVPEGHLFVMGDNRNNSSDSRYPVVGCVDERRLLGKVIFRLLPFSVFGKVNG